jgi:hypothetical protein
MSFIVPGVVLLLALLAIGVLGGARWKSGRRDVPPFDLW